MSNMYKPDTVLIVDDDLAIRLLMKEALSGCDLNIIEAESGEQALAQFITHLPDLTLLDVTMPGMNGHECCRQLKMLPKGQECCIVMVTALERPEDVEAAFEAGASDFLTKPLKWPIFQNRVTSILKASKTLRELSKHKNKLARAQSIAQLGYWEWDFTSQSANISAELCGLLGLETSQSVLEFAEVIGIVHPEDRYLVKRALRSAINYKIPYEIEYRIIYPSGEVHTVHDHTEIVKEYGDWQIIGTLQDITNRKRSEQQIARYVNYDTLTQLPNRSLFIEITSAAVSVAMQNKEMLSLLLINLDFFKDVNTTYGHRVGDELLCKAASLIKDALSPTNVLDSNVYSHLARLDADEFALLVCDVDDIESVATIAERIISLFEKPFFIKGHEIHISISIGISCYPDADADANSLLKQASVAAYHAKEVGRKNYQFFSESMNLYLTERLQVESDLRVALDRNEFELYYQPQVAAKSESTVGFEALLRWNHPTRGIVGPDIFIEIAERTGLILPIGNWVLNQACQQAKLWQHTLQNRFRVAVNISALQFTHSCLPEQVSSALEESGLEADMLELEITETAIIKDVSEAISLLYTLKDIGVTLAIDDFGTGYSSLNYLKSFPIDTLKIDKSFVDYIVTDEKDAAIAQTIVQLATNLSLITVAEGVETNEQKLLLKKMGCTEFQGYYFSKPLTVSNLEQQYAKPD